MKVNKVVMMSIILIVFFSPAIVAAQEDTNTISFETYFAPPSQEFGEFKVKDLRFNLSADEGSVCTEEEEGTLYFSGENHHIYICRQERWELFGSGVWEEELDEANQYIYTRFTNPGDGRVDSGEEASARTYIGLQPDDDEASNLFSLEIGKVDSDGSLLVDGGILAFGKLGAGDTFSVLGSRTGFMWYPRKAAIMAGYSWGEWIDGNIGEYSSAFGDRPRASGASSFVTGGFSSTSGLSEESVAMGFQVHADARGSVALGRRITANYPAELVVGAYGYTFSSNGNSLEDPIFVIAGGLSSSDYTNSVVSLRSGTFGIKEDSRTVVSPSWQYDTQRGINSGDAEKYFPIEYADFNWFAWIDASMHVLGDVVFLEDNEPQILFAQRETYPSPLSPDEIAIGTTSSGIFRIRSYSSRSNPIIERDIFMIVPDGFGEFYTGINMDPSSGDVPLYTLDVHGDIHSGGGDEADKVISASGFIQTLENILPTRCEKGQIKYQNTVLYGCDNTLVWKAFAAVAP